MTFLFWAVAVVILLAIINAIACLFGNDVAGLSESGPEEEDTHGPPYAGGAAHEAGLSGPGPNRRPDDAIPAPAGSAHR